MRCGLTKQKCLQKYNQYNPSQNGIVCITFGESTRLSEFSNCTAKLGLAEKLHETITVTKATCTHRAHSGKKAEHTE